MPARGTGGRYGRTGDSDAAERERFRKSGGMARHSSPVPSKRSRNCASSSSNCLIRASFSRRIEWRNLNMARFSSKEVSVRCLGRMSVIRSSISCPPRCSNCFCTTVSYSCCGSSTITRDSSFSLAYASTMAMVVCTAFGLFRMVASI